MQSIIHKIDRNRQTVLFSLFLIAFVLRVFLTLLNFNLYGTEDWSDAKLYLAHGLSFAEGDFFPSYEAYDFMIVGPIIPLIVALSKITTGNPIIPVLIFNCLISAFLVFVLFDLGRRVINQTAGYFLALWSVFNFSLIRFNYQILKEPMLFLLLPVILLCLVKLYQKERIAANIVLSSVMFSILIHTDERFVLYAILFIVFIVIAVPRSLSLKMVSLWIVVSLLLLAPWIFRNYKQFDQLVVLTPRTTAFTSKLWGSDLANLHFSSEEGIDKHIENRQERAQDFAMRYGIEPRRYGKHEKYFRSFIHYWKPAYFRLTYIQSGYRPVKWSLGHNLSSLIFYGLFLPFYIGGIVLAIKKKNWLMIFLWMLPFIHSLIHTMMIWPLERYRLPMDFLVVLLAIWYIEKYLTKSLILISRKRLLPM